MFEDFENRRDRAGRRRAVTSTVISIVVYAAVGVVGASAFKKEEAGPEEEEIEVTFQKMPEVQVAPPPAPPPPPPPPETKVRKAPPPRRDAMAAPTAIPDEAPPEGDPSQGLPVPTEPEPEPEPEPPPPPPVEAPPPPPAPKPRPKRSEPINLPENATPAQPAADNVAPVYPADKKAEGVEGLVVLKIVITESGAVGDVQVLKGDEPFVSAAVSAVRRWRYSPALVDGQPVASYKVVKIPFRLTK
jgi:protein TonB